MDATEFIERLTRHYAKRHDSVEKQIAWTREMIECVSGIDKRLLDKAFELIRDEHEERAFPLPATLKRYIGRAAEVVYPEGQRQAYSYGRAPAAQIDPKRQREYDLAREWQQGVIDQYGSWAAHWRATRHLHKSLHLPKAYEKPFTPSNTLSRAKRRRINVKSGFAAVDRIAMQTIQARAPHLHMERKALTMRITGERD